MKPTKELLEEIIQAVQPLIGQGKVADYIPALASVHPNKLVSRCVTKTVK